MNILASIQMVANIRNVCNKGRSVVVPLFLDRDAQMAGFLQGICLPDEVALVTLYGTAALELSLGLAFLILLLWSFLPEERKQKADCWLIGPSTGWPPREVC